MSLGTADTKEDVRIKSMILIKIQLEYSSSSLEMRLAWDRQKFVNLKHDRYKYKG